MNFELWAPVYEEIRRDFGFRWEPEVEAARTLRFLLGDRAPSDPLAFLRPRLADQDAVVVGNAPRAGAPPLWRLPSSSRPAVIAADGATAPCLDAGIVPDVIVTDLDGPVPSEVAANQRGAVVVVHAHGDNLDALRRWVPQFPGSVLGSWAGAPEPQLLNVGGFTDGDRGAYLAEALGVRRILLWGFDFSNTVGEDDPERKRKKLDWARRNLRDLARRTPVPVLGWEPDGRFSPYPAAGEPVGASGERSPD